MISKLRINFDGTLLLFETSSKLESSSLLFSTCHLSVRFVLLNYSCCRVPKALLNYCFLSVHFRHKTTHTGRGLVVLTMNSAGRSFEPYQVRASCRSWPRCASNRAGIERCNQCSVVPQNEPLVMLRPFFRSGWVLHSLRRVRDPARIIVCHARAQTCLLDVPFPHTCARTHTNAHGTHL